MMISWSKHFYKHFFDLHATSIIHCSQGWSLRLTIWRKYSCINLLDLLLIILSLQNSIKSILRKIKGTYISISTYFRLYKKSPSNSDGMIPLIFPYCTLQEAIRKSTDMEEDMIERNTHLEIIPGSVSR